MASGRLIDYMGTGLAAARPVSLSLHAGTAGFYFATDTNVMSAWDGTVWNDVEGVGIAEYVTYDNLVSGLVATDVQAAIDEIVSELGTASASDVGDFATATQGATADSAVQPVDLAAVATSGDVDDLIGFPGGTTDFLRADGAFAAPVSAPVIVPIIIAAGDETTALTTGTGKVTFRMPYAFTLTGVRASVNTAPTGSVLTVDINEAGVSILSTKLTIDATEKTSTTAAAAAVISDTALADDAEISIDVDTIGSTIAGAGLKVTLLGYKT